MEQLQLKDFLNYRFLSGVRYAPGGKRAAFVVANCNEEENCYELLVLRSEAASAREIFLEQGF